MHTTSVDRLSLRNGQVLQGTCLNNSFSMSTSELNFGINKRAIKRIRFGLQTNSDILELKSGQTYSGELFSVTKTIEFRVEGETNSSSVPFKDLACIVLDVNVGESDDAACVVCGCTEDHPCLGGCHWADDGNMRDICSRCA